MKKEIDNPICYAGVDDMGNILAAVVHQDDYPAHTAIALATFIMKGMHVIPMDVESIRQTFGREFEGPPDKTPKFRVQVSYMDNHGIEIHLSEGDKTLKPDCEDDDFMPIRPLFSHDEAEYQLHKQASEVLKLLGVNSWSGIRTFGDIERLRERIAQTV